MNSVVITLEYLKYYLFYFIYVEIKGLENRKKKEKNLLKMMREQEWFWELRRRLDIEAAGKAV